MANNTSRSSRQDAETCAYLDFMAWQQSYLTDDTRASSTALIILHSVTSIVAIVLNALVLEAVRTRRRLRNNTTILLACLAGTDLMFGALVQPLLIARETRHILTDGPFCVADTACVLAVYFGCMLSFYHLLLVSLERYVAIKHHLRYEAILTRQRLNMGIALAWALPLAEVFGQFVMIELLKFDSWLWYIASLMSVLYISGMIYIHVTIYLEAGRVKKRLKSEQIPQEQAIKLQKSNKAARTVSIILGTLLMTYLPYTILEIIEYIFPAIIERRVFYILSSWFVFIVSCSSLLNPLVYCYRVKKLRRAFLEILHFTNRENVAHFETNCGTREQFNSSGGHLATRSQKEAVMPSQQIKSTRRLSPIEDVDERLKNHQPDGTNCGTREQLKSPEGYMATRSQKETVMVCQPIKSTLFKKPCVTLSLRTNYLLLPKICLLLLPELQSFILNPKFTNRTIQGDPLSLPIDVRPNVFPNT